MNRIDPTELLRSHARRLALLVATTFSLGLATTGALAAPVMWIHDSGGTLGKVDVATGNVALVGNMGTVLTDIAFSPSGALYGVSFNALYSVNTSSAAATLIGNLGVTGMNALVFNADGTLYAAGLDSKLYTVNIGTGAASSLGSTGFTSGGDLAFYESKLYLASAGNQLVDVDVVNPSNSTAVGSFGFNDVFGLATGDDNVLYGVSGTQIFSINPLTGDGTLVANYAGKGLGQAYGQSFVTEAGGTDPGGTAPLPSTFLLLAVAFASMGFARRIS